ncbi:DUF4328 domain-containing protein [Actinokineospora sp. 24-640]
MPRPLPKSIRELGLWLSGLLVLTAVVMGLWVLVPAADAAVPLLVPGCMVLTVVWLHRARSNVEGLGGQRRHRAWVIWGWLCPVVNLWFPLQVVGDVARVDRHDEGAAGAAFLRYGWWACWVLAWVTGFTWSRVVHLVPGGGAVERTQFHFALGGSLPGKVLAAVAGVLLALVVHDISTRQEKRLRAPSHSDSAVAGPQ